MAEDITENNGKNNPASREQFFSEFLKVLTVPFIKPCAEGFFQNIRQTESLLLMPIIMFGFLEVENHIADDFRTSAVEHWSLGKDCSSFLKDFHYKPFRVSDIPDFGGRVQKRIDETLIQPVFGPPLQQAMQVLYSAAISASWTALECLASDLWVASLNEGAVPLAQNAFTTLDQLEPCELTSKQIPVGLAARYGFDLRHCLGTVLKPKFDFTSVSGIQKAYKVFPMKDDHLQRLLAAPLLSELEATRHLIVHRASTVDGEYKRRTSSTLEVGTQFSFSKEKVSSFAMVSQETGFQLLAEVNDWFNVLRTHPNTKAPVSRQRTHRGDAERVAGEAGGAGDAGKDVEVAPEVVGGVGEGGGKMTRHDSVTSQTIPYPAEDSAGIITIARWASAWRGDAESASLRAHIPGQGRGKGTGTGQRSGAQLDRTGAAQSAAHLSPETPHNFVLRPGVPYSYQQHAQS